MTCNAKPENSWNAQGPSGTACCGNVRHGSSVMRTSWLCQQKGETIAKPWSGDLQPKHAYLAQSVMLRSPSAAPLLPQSTGLSSLQKNLLSVGSFRFPLVLSFPQRFTPLLPTSQPTVSCFLSPLASKLPQSQADPAPPPLPSHFLPVRVQS